MKDWIKARKKERTTLDGTVMIGAGIAFLILGPLAVIAAYAVIMYGVVVVIKKD
jgi:hypothetical protein|tara:strand:+ start:21723 stop:21884 length:162 start_codon:yes stop_codon:yes gene_type:complete